ncbi:2,3-bisphosphoglycerate-independent phosphoglycerate mutase [Nitrospina watsonii]|uniref:2,3-bisphosphoglycerate-independent phosphoglycerate mutase n=1 Tax=Nitrospina watsonii TaxID=1323948 RepID=A0ABM9HAL9_9BACT|nr:2,3-bisphosphoglycerate-independent phosphoglycerate mutase [Nitrospina watsonii]CAI2717177.1 putative 2,3-bisphosphoglycerate-independent phosphoglycerate mutase [Nitrospina watsonii]
MKYLIVLANGLSDHPIAERDNKTPLTLADTPNLDRIAAEGRTGSVRTVPEGLPAGGEVSCLSLLGYDPEKHGAGAAEYVAHALGVEVKSNEVPLCCDFIILQTSHNDMIVKDFTAGQLSDHDAGMLIEALQDKVMAEGVVTFHSGKGYHNLMVMESAPFPSRLMPPNELIGEGIRQHIPQDAPYRDLVNIMNQAQIILHNHGLNRKRMADGGDAVNSVWFWGNANGRNRQPLPEFFSRFEKKGAVVTASLLMQGIARQAGMTVLQVEGATGFADTNYKGKVDAAITALETHDVVYLHMTGAEIVSLQGNIDDKIAAIEDMDEQVLEPILHFLETRKDVTLLVTENHMSSVDRMRYDSGPVPLAVYPPAKGKDATAKFDEDLVQNGAEHFKDGPALIEALLKGAL